MALIQADSSGEVLARSRYLLPARSAFAGFRFPLEVIVVAVRWYLRFNLSYRDVDELLVERRIEVDHVTVHRGYSGSRRSWPPRPDPPGTRPATGGSSTMTYVKVNRRVAIRVPGGRPAWTGHRRARVGSPGRSRGPPVLPTGTADVEGDAHRGSHRRRRGLPGVLVSRDAAGVIAPRRRSSLELCGFRLGGSIADQRG